MGRTISATGIAGKGANFRFSLPFGIARPASECAAKPLEPRRTPTTETRSLRVLIAEDSPSNRMVFNAMLADTPYDVETVNHGKAAVEAFERSHYDIVLMDIYMPEMDRIEATKFIRANPNSAHVLIIALTANAMKRDQERFLEAGMDDDPPKPIDRARLAAKIAEWSKPHTKVRSKSGSPNYQRN